MSSATVLVAKPPASVVSSAPDSQVSNKSMRRVGRWYFGGIASAMAASCTHPLDLVKVSGLAQLFHVSF